MPKNPKKISWLKFGTAFLICVLLFIFVNPTTYNLIKSLFIEDSEKFLEMRAYARIKKDAEKYFVVQENDYAKSLVEEDLKIIEKNQIETLSCPKNELILFYEMPDEAITAFAKKYQGVEMVLNQDSEIEFYITKIQGRETCQIE